MGNKNAFIEKDDRVVMRVERYEQDESLPSLYACIERARKWWGVIRKKTVGKEGATLDKRIWREREIVRTKGWRLSNSIRILNFGSCEKLSSILEARRRRHKAPVGEKGEKCGRSVCCSSRDHLALHCFWRTFLWGLAGFSTPSLECSESQPVILFFGQFCP